MISCLKLHSGGFSMDLDASCWRSLWKCCLPGRYIAGLGRVKVEVVGNEHKKCLQEQKEPLMPWEKGETPLIPRVLFLATEGRCLPWMSCRKQEHIGINFLLGVKSSIDLLGRTKVQHSLTMREKRQWWRAQICSQKLKQGFSQQTIESKTGIQGQLRIARMKCRRK